MWPATNVREAMEIGHSHGNKSGQPSFSRHKESDNTAPADADQETAKSGERIRAADTCSHYDDSTGGNVRETHLFGQYHREIHARDQSTVIAGNVS